MAWIEMHQTRQKHPKTLRLASLIKCERRYACGLLDDLWTWAIDVAGSDGSLRGLTPEDIAVALDYPRKKGKWLVGIFVESGWIDILEDGTYCLHDWAQYTGRLNDKRQKDAEYRRKKRGKSDECRINVGTTNDRQTTDSVTMSALTVPNRTLPYPTVPNQDTGEISLSLPPLNGNGEREFSPPSAEEVKRYADEAGLAVDADAFIRANAANGWKDGNGQPIRNWKIWMQGSVLRHTRGSAMEPDPRISALEQLKRKYLAEEADNDQA